MASGYTKSILIAFIFLTIFLSTPQHQSQAHTGGFSYKDVFQSPKCPPCMCCQTAIPPPCCYCACYVTQSGDKTP